MARPYSLDLREHVVSAVASGQTCRAVASNFDVAVSTVVEWVGRVCRTGSVAPGKMGGHRPYILEPERDWLLARIEEKPDLTLHALGAKMTDRGVSVRSSTCSPPQECANYIRNAGYAPPNTNGHS